MVVALVAAAVAVAALALVIWPPRATPRVLRRWTRPVRRLVRPGHYRGY